MGLLDTEIIDGNLDIDKLNPDWNYVDNVLENERKKSVEYLDSVCN